MSRRELVDRMGRDLWDRGDLNDRECISIAEYLIEKGWVFPTPPSESKPGRIQVVVNKGFDPTVKVTPTYMVTRSPLIG